MTAPGRDPESATDGERQDRPSWPDEPNDWEPPTILGIEDEHGDIFEQFDSYAEYQSYREELEERVIEMSLAELIFEGLPKGWCESADPTPHELLAEQIGKIDVEGKYLDFEATPNLSGKLSTGEAFRLYIFDEFSTLPQLRLANRLNRKSFRERLAVYESVSQPTINRIENRVPPEADGYVKGEREVLADRLRAHEMDTNALKLPDPEPTPDGSGPPEVVEIARQMRQSIQQFIRFDRDASTRYAKDELLSILAAAGKDGIFPNEAAENLALKPFYYERPVRTVKTYSTISTPSSSARSNRCSWRRTRP